MQLLIKYTELSKEIKRLTDHDIDFQYVCDDTVKIIIPLNIPFYGPSEMGVDVKIIGFDFLTLKVKTTSDILSKIVEMMTDLNISKYISFEGDVVSVLLGNIEQFRNVFSFVHPTAIGFDKASMRIEADAV